MSMNCLKVRVTTEYIPAKLRVKSISVLTEEQYFEYRDEIPTCAELWWLLGKEYAENSGSVYEGYAKCVIGMSGLMEIKRAYDGFEDASILDLADLRPIVITENTLRVGDTFILCDEYGACELTAISPNMAIFSKTRHVMIPYSENMIKDYLESFAMKFGREVKVKLDLQ